MTAWTKTTLGKICKVDWGNTSLTKKSYVEEGKYAAVSATGSDGRIDFAEHKAGTPVLSAIGAQCGKMFLPKEDFTAIKNTITLTPYPDICSGEYLFHLFNAIELPKRGAAQPFISKGDIQSFEIAIPSLPVQKAIVAKLDELITHTIKLSEIHKTKSRSFNALKQSLLQQAFNGQLVDA